MSASESAEHAESFAKELENWYWEHGHKRTGRFTLPTGGWLRELRHSRNSLQEIRQSKTQTRPAVAIWGPSQTGKSTAVSAYIDAKASYTGDESEDGIGSALYWPGGAPAYFIHPSLTKDAPGDLHRLVLNPYNSGMDASACLSRFVKGSLSADDPDAFPVPDANFPIGIELAREYELWMSIARGYNSQCWGPKPEPEHDASGRPVPRYQTVWTVEKFLAALNRHAGEFVETDGGMRREAFERLHLFCRLIDDLVFAGLPRYRQLATGEVGWDKISEWILSGTLEESELPNALLYSLEAADAFVAEILWDSYQVITDYALEMRQRLAELNLSFAGKPIYASIEVAMLFLDMETYKIALMRPSERPKPKETRVRELLNRLRWEDRGGHIVIGAERSFPNPLLSGAEDFGIVQGLIWELVIALNPANLEDNAFAHFIEVADLLDFPGVERGGKESPADKIDLDILGEMKRRGQFITEPDSTGDDPFQFFCKLLKRGKTSSIVCTYAQRMNIDIFNVFQDIDKDKPNGDELVTGIHTWWQACVPEYYRNQQGKSPMPLNYALLWWSEFFSARQDFTNISKKLEPVGQISNPEVSTAFAMNYYYIPGRGEMPAAVRESIPGQVEYLEAETAFARQFLSNPVSEGSFRAMLADQKTGGAEYFFTQITRQAAEVVAIGDASPRVQTLHKHFETVRHTIDTLTSAPDFMPQVRETDDRRETILALRDKVADAVEAADQAKIEALEAALRFLLDVNDRSLRPLPQHVAAVTLESIRDQIQAWVRSQASRPLTSFPAHAVTGLEAIGLDDSDARTAFLQAMVASIEPELTQLARWVADLVQHHAMGDASVDLRRFIAVSMSNLFTRVSSDDPLALLDVEPESMDALLDEDLGEKSWTRKGRELPRYHVFLKPLIGEGGVLEQLAMRDLVPVTRPDQPGDRELLELMDQHPGNGGQ